MVARIGRIVLVAATVGLLAAPLADTGVGTPAFVVASLLVPGALLLSTVPSRGAAGGRIAAALILTLLLEGGALWLLAGTRFPAAAWIMLGVLGLAPLLLVPAIHAARASSDHEEPL